MSSSQRSSAPGRELTTSADDATFSLRALGLSTYLPTLLYSVGQGAIAPIVALSARDVGASVGVASLIVACTGIGQLLGDLPAGAIAARFGDRRAMLVAVGLVSVALTGCLLATNVWVLGLSIVGTGLAAAVFGLARHAFLTEVVPYPMRARAMSTLGGVNRVGMFTGPFLGAAAMHFLGTPGAYWVHLATALLVGVVLLVVKEPVHRGLSHAAAHGGSTEMGASGVAESTAAATVAGASTASAGSVGTESSRMFAVIGRHFRLLRTLGLGALLVAAVRASRQVVIPLWAEQLHLDATTTSLIFGAAGALDMLLFYPAGKLMDRYGRVWVAVPSMLLLALAHVLLPATVGVVSLTAVALLMGFGNGMGSGIIMTLGADAAPARGRSAFLGAWRLCSDLGNGAGPVVISTVSTAAALGPAILAMGVVGLAGAWAMHRWIPRPPAQRE